MEYLIQPPEHRLHEMKLRRTIWNQLSRKKISIYWLLFVALCVVVGYPCFIAQSKPIVYKGQRKSCFHGTCITNIGHSGKFIITHKNQNDDQGSTIEFDAIQELDGNYNEIGKTGSHRGKHSFNSLAELHFDFTPLVNTTNWSIPAACFNFYATIPGPNAKLNVQICIFKEKGTIPLCDGLEKYQISPGMMKFNIEISKWTFCGDGENCRNDHRIEIGEYMHFSIKIKSSGQAKKGEKGKDNHRGEPQKFVFGNNRISFPNILIADNNKYCYRMPEKYPITEAVSDGYKITLWFPKFKKSLTYNSVAEVNIDGTSFRGSPIRAPLKNVLARLLKCSFYSF